MNRPIGLIADDLTGANDTGVQFAHSGLQVTVYLEDLSQHNYSDVMVFNTSSRNMKKDDAFHICEKAVYSLRKAGAVKIYKKIDSTMRGNIGSELEGVMKACNCNIAVVTPAYPKLGRTLLHGCIYVDGKPLVLSELSHDPLSPTYGVRAAEIIASQSSRRIAEIHIEEVRNGERPLLEKMQKVITTGAEILLIDAVTQDDLKILAGALKMLETPHIVSGAGGLASALIENVPHFSAPAIDMSRGILLVCGSFTNAAREQINRAKEMGILTTFIHTSQQLLGDPGEVGSIIKVLTEGKTAAICIGPGDIQDNVQENGRMIREAVAGLACRVMKHHRPGALILTGGDTALAVCLHLGAWGIQLQGEIESGVPYGLLKGKWYNNSPIITKAGTFGDKDTFVRILKSLYCPSVNQTAAIKVAQ